MAINKKESKIALYLDLASILLDVTNDNFSVDNLPQNIATMSTLLSINPRLIKSHLQFKLYLLCA